MSRWLQIDAGNTCLKWRVLVSGRVQYTGILDNRKDLEIAFPGELSQVKHLDAACISNVSGKTRLSILQRILREYFGIELQIARPVKVHSGLTLSYEEPSRLGVDRWLTMLSTQQAYPEQLKIVVSCGTAMTTDVIDTTGLHMGGYVVPGLELMRSALTEGTSDIGLMNHTPGFALGKSTEECVEHGVLSMSAALIERLWLQYDNALIILSGGNAEKIMTGLTPRARIVIKKGLVMDGLSLLFRGQRQVI